MMMVSIKQLKPIMYERDKAMEKPRIEEIRIKTKFDDSPDTSYLGEYTDDYPGEDALKRGSAFDRNAGQREYRYFVPMNSVEDHRQGLSRIGYSRSQAEDMAREYCRQDYKRMEALNAGEWHYIGVMVEARVSYSIGNGTRRLEWFESGGLWGIESDSGEEYLAEVAQEQIQDLREHLNAFNVDTSEFEAKAKEALKEVDWDYIQYDRF